MKKYLSYLCMLITVAILGCNKEEECVFNQVYPNEYKEFLPYSIGEEIYFKNGIGQMDTMTVKNSISKTFVLFRQDCPFKTEMVECELQTQWQDSTTSNSNHILAIRDVVLTRGTIAINTNHYDFQATNFGGPPAGGNIERIDSFHFSGKTYSDVLLSTCLLDQECPFVDSIGFVKGKGLTFYTLNGKPWVLVE